MPQPTIGDTATQIIGGTSGSAVLLQNIGSTPAYLAQGTGVTSTSYDYVLPAGGNLTWPAATTLYASAAPGETAQLSYGPSGVNASASTIGLAPGTVVDIAPGAVVDIAAGSSITVNGPVSLANGTAVGLAAGATAYGKAIHGVTQLAQITLQPNVPGGDVWANVNVADYASLYITINQGSNGGTNTIDPGNYVEIDIVAGYQTQCNPQWLLPQNPANFNMMSSLKIPVINSTYDITLYFIQSLAGTTLPTVTLYGSNEILTEPEYIQGSSGISTMGANPYGTPYSQSLAGATSVLQYIATKNGPANIYLGKTGSTQFGLLNIAFANNGNVQNLAALSVAAAAAQYTYQSTNIILPMRPIRYYLYTTGTDGNIEGTITQ